MAESDVASFALWSVITVIIMGLAAFSYKSYNKRKNEITPS